MTPGQLRAWFAAEYPTRNWDGKCAGVAYNACRATGGAVQVYGSATEARLASAIVSGESRLAPPGAAHFWDYWARIDGVYANYGHTAISLGGGAALMSNPEAWDDQWGIVMGVTDVPAWTARRAGIVTYRGWSYGYGSNICTITTDAASGGSTPFGGFLMALTDQQQADLLNMVTNVYAAVFNGGPSMPDGGRSLSASVDGIVRVVDRIAADVSPIMRTVGGEVVPVSLRQEVADAKTNTLTLLGRPTGEVKVDAKDVAAALVPLLAENQASLITAIKALPAETIAALKSAL